MPLPSPRRPRRGPLRHVVGSTPVVAVIARHVASHRAGTLSGSSWAVEADAPSARCASSSAAISPARIGAANDVPLHTPKPPEKSPGSIVARRSPGRRPASTVDGARDPAIVTGIVDATAAPGRGHVTQGPSSLNSAVVPSGLRAATASTRGSVSGSAGGATGSGGVVDQSSRGANAAGNSGSVLPELPAEATTATPRRRSVARSRANGASKSASSGRSWRYPNDSTSTSTGK